MPPDLPQELIEYIIDFLYDDLSSLNACSLTCKAWINASRHHLFQSITLVFSLKLPYLVKNFVQTMQSCPAIANHITDLHFNLDLFNPLSQQTLLQLFQSLSSHLPRVNALTCTGCMKDAVAEGILNPINLDIITNLNLRSAFFGPVQGCIDFVTLFSNLEKLSLPFSVWEQNRLIKTFMPVSPKLYWLEVLFSGPLMSLLQWVQTFAFQLRHFEVSFRVYSLRDISDLGTLLESLGSNITYLHLHSKSWRCDDEILERNGNSFHLANTLTSLQNLELTRIYLGGYGKPNGNNWIHLFLENLCSSRLTRARFELQLSSLIDVEKSLEEFDWERFDNTLSWAQFSKLDEIEFVVTSYDRSVGVEVIAEQGAKKLIPVSDMLKSRLGKTVKIIMPDEEMMLPVYRMH